MKRKGLWITLSAAVVVILALVIWRVGFYESAVEVDTMMVTRGEISEVIYASGRVEPNCMTVIVSRGYNEIEEILVHEGDDVSEGQELINFRHAELVNFPYVSRTMKSPIEGKVVKIDCSVGQWVPIGTPLMSIADMSILYVVANVDEFEISKVEPNQTAKIIPVAYPEAAIEGKVVEISFLPTFTIAGGTAFPVKIEVTSVEGATLRLGMSVDVEIVSTTHKDVIIVPLEAVVYRDGRYIVFVVEDSIAKAQEVEVGICTDYFGEIESGLTLGQEIVIENADKLRGGERVK